MSETKFTPGPWRIEQGDIDGPVIWGGPADDPLRICGQVDIWGADPQFAANTHLIAAAPDLYEAAHNAAALLRAPTGPDDPIAVAIIHAIEVAQAKARGEPQP